MTLSPDNTVREILSDNKLDKIMFEKAKQSLDSHYLSIFKEVAKSCTKKRVVPNSTIADFEYIEPSVLEKALQDRLGGKS